ncbi:SDR family oxidoreductase [Parasalinivibrio latis]|uniref:SDR family NAD(P)-dependent oxidoreductase n=1 Tax=Parasalinivibrio latis TaxID=2952610 RepID=UPI0030E274F1
MMLEAKIAVVTGSASGIGLAIARAFAKEGARLALIDLDNSALEKARREFDTDATLCIPCNVTDPEQVEKALVQVSEYFGGIDILVNNAGIASIGTVETTTEDDFNKVMAVNVNGVFNFMKYAIPYLVESKGVILNMASIASKLGLSDRFAYSASKGAVLSMTYSVAKDFVSQGVRCNCLCPARIYTPFVEGYLNKHYPDNRDEMFATISNYQPIGRMGTPDEVADAAVFLCSDKASFVTGNAFDFDGGVTNIR